MKINKVFTAVIFTLLFSLIHFHAFSQGDGVHTVVIDAGHGGNDPGNLGTRRYKTKEKDIALSVALKVGQYITQNLKDVKVVYTRKTDVFIPLEKRAQIANDAEADVFISIHCDAFTKSTVNGSTSIVLGRNHNDENMRVAIKENSVILLEENYEETYQGFDPRKPETLIALTLYQSAFLEQSISLAQKIQDQFKYRVKRKDRGVKQQPLYVTSRTAMPAVLVELGFLTNPKEEDFLNSEQGQSYMASAIYRALKAYKEERDEFSKLKVKSIIKDTTTLVKPKVTEDTKPLVNNKNEEAQNRLEDPRTTFYTVQVATSALKKELKPENFKGQEGVELYEDQGFYKYIIGRVYTLKEAHEIKQKLKKAGFKDAFVIALSEGKRIPLEEAHEMLQ